MTMDGERTNPSWQWSTKNDSTATKLWTFLGSPGVKFILIGILTFMLTIPSLFVWVLVEERSDRAKEVARDIARSWGGTQEVNGPYLVVPYSETITTGVGERSKTTVNWHKAVLFPEKLDVAAETNVEERHRSIYSLPVYSSKLRISGRFAAPPENMFAPRLGGSIKVESDKAILVVGIADIRALKSEVSAKLDSKTTIAFEPGLGPLSAQTHSRGRFGSFSGINVSIPTLKWRSGFSFEIPMHLNGSSGLFVAPAGQSTQAKMQSNWPHPSFTGAFLPDARAISEKGFEASWSIPYLARGIPKTLVTNQLPLQDKLVGVKFVEPANFYQTISRSMKYAIGFIGLVFLAAFVLEMRSPGSFHWIQYALVGLSLIVFYVMLLARAEHLGYGFAYFIAATAATLLNAIYLANSLKSRMAGITMFSTLAAIFAVLYALMQEQDYALLIGSMIAFLALAITMFVTQKIDWTGTTHKTALAS